jgi:nicotinate phosphoribosyltransferase
MKKKSLCIATEKEIREGLTTDVYFERTVRILKGMKISKRVKAEIATKSLPSGYTWGIVTGLEECLTLLDGADRRRELRRFCKA